MLNFGHLRYQNFTAKSKKCLKNHLDQVHIGEEFYICDRSVSHLSCTLVKDFIRLFINTFRCNFKSQSKLELEGHIKSHTKQTRSFFCEMCGLNFDKRHLLNRHVKIKHTVKERRYKCSHQDCDKGG